MIKKTLAERDTSCLILSFGHQHSGKSYGLLGQNNHQLYKSITDVPVSKAHDSRGVVLRCISDIREREPASKLTLQYIDVSLENVRDILKHVKKERIKQQSILAVNFSERVFSAGSDRPSS